MRRYIEQYLTPVNLLYISGVVACLIFALKQLQPKPQNKHSNVPDATFTELVAREFDNHGKLTRKLQAPYAAHYRDRRITKVARPHFELRTSKSPSHLTADEAILTQSRLLKLKQHVTLTQHKAKGDVRMHTDHMTVNLKQKTADTDAFVRVRQGNSLVIEGTGAHADLNKQTVELKHHVRGHYAAQH